MKSGLKNTKWLICIVYGLLLLYVLFFRSIGTSYPWTYPEYLHAMHNFIPLKSVYVLLASPVISFRSIARFLINFVGNIVLFVPFGVLLPACVRRFREFRRFAAVTIIVLVLIETIQIFSMLGSFDIEDILLNMLGACAGFACCKKCVVCHSFSLERGLASAAIFLSVLSMCV